MALAAHPGLANTNIKRQYEAVHPPGPIRRWCAHHMTKIIPTAANAARSVILAAAGDAVTGGEYYGPGGLFELGGAPKPARLHPATRDMERSRELWNISEVMTGVRYLSNARAPRTATSFQRDVNDR